MPDPPTWPVVARLFAGSLPAWVGEAERATVSGPSDLVDTSPHPEELELVARAVETRRTELLTGRTLARAALGMVGVETGAIGRRADRSPDWPVGVLGSITHTRGLCSVAVVRIGPDAPVEPGVEQLIGVGLDAEIDAPLEPAVADRVLTAGERERLGVRARSDAVVVFSAKEAVFKAINPATGAWLEPDEVEVEIRRDDALGPGETDGGTVSVRSWSSPVPGLEPSDVRGRWCRFAPWVLVGVVATRAG